MNDHEQTQWVRQRIQAIRVINDALSRMINRKIELSNYGQKHPNTYTISVDDEITNIVIGWEELISMTELSDIEQLASDIQDRIKERENE